MIGVCEKLDVLLVLFPNLLFILKEAIEDALALVALLSYLFLNFCFFLLLALFCNNVISNLGKVLLEVPEFLDEELLDVIEFGLSLL